MSNMKSSGPAIATAILGPTLASPSIQCGW
jgi:hypothetical protein